MQTGFLCLVSNRSALSLASVYVSEYYGFDNTLLYNGGETVLTLSRPGIRTHLIKPRAPHIRGR